MPNRILKETIKHSPEIDELNWFEEVVFYRLMVTVDDYGCFDGRTIVLKNELFPTKDNVSKKAIGDAISKLASVGLLREYVVSGKPYVTLPSWERHQRVRNKHRKYPEPPEIDACQSFDSQMTASRLPESESNPIRIQSESESKRARPRGEAFDVFWAAYPKKVGKIAAKKAFDKVSVPVETLVSAIRRQECSCQWSKDNGQFIPNPATWLNQGRWEDEVSKPKISNPFLELLEDEP